MLFKKVENGLWSTSQGVALGITLNLKSLIK
jgi:hypothetical protein